MSVAAEQTNKGDFELIYFNNFDLKKNSLVYSQLK